MRTRICQFTIMAMVIVSLFSCNGCGKKSSSEDSIQIIGVDSLPSIIEMEGMVGQGTSMNILELISDDSDTVYISAPTDIITGGVNIGDRLSVIYCVNRDENIASVAVNLSALTHLWTQKGSDGQSQSLELDPKGIAITYNMKIDYCNWEVKDGQLLLHTPKKVASEVGEIIDTFQILSLTDEQLVLSNGRYETIFSMDN